MSRKAAKKAKPTPRGRQGGRKSKFGTPMISKSLRMREDTWEMIVDGAAAEQISQGEWVMRRLYPPHIWAMLNHEPQNRLLSCEAAVISSYSSGKTDSKP